MNRSQAFSCYFLNKLPPWCQNYRSSWVPLLRQCYHHPSINSASHLRKPLQHFCLPLPAPSISRQTLLILSPKPLPPISAPSFKSHCFNSGLVTSCLEHCKILLIALTQSIIHKPYCHWSVLFKVCHQSR